VKPRSTSVRTSGGVRVAAGDTRGGRTSYELYLNEIGQTPMITPDEEVKLARRIRRGDKAARETMIKANLRLVVHIAHDFEHFGVPLLDLISEGNLGLIKAVERFDPRKGAKLSTYAAWWIKQAMRRAVLRQGRTVRLSEHQHGQLLKMRRAEARLEMILGREPSVEELAEELEVHPRRIGRLRAMLNGGVSLDAPLDRDDEERRVGDIIADQNVAAPYENIDTAARVRLLGAVMQGLDQREQRILRERFGLDGRAGRTLDEVGAKLGVTRERVRQIQELALKKLRRELAEYNEVSLHG
jgi:RNA polymerase primary sigma factor